MFSQKFVSIYKTLSPSNFYERELVNVRIAIARHSIGRRFGRKNQLLNPHSYETAHTFKLQQTSRVFVILKGDVRCDFETSKQANLLLKSDVLLDNYYSFRNSKLSDYFFVSYMNSGM